MGIIYGWPFGPREGGGFQKKMAREARFYLADFANGAAYRLETDVARGRVWQ